MAKMTFESERAKRRIERIQFLLRREYMNCLQLSEEIYMSPVRAREYIRYLLKTNQVHVYRWDKREFEGKAHWIAVYAWGNAKSAKKPISGETNAERLKRRYHERKRDDPDWYESMLAKLKATRLKPKADPMLNWIPRRGESHAKTA